MSDPSGGKSSAARPRQLTLAAGFVIGGSVFLMLTVFDTLTTLNSVDMRDEITRMLDSPTGEGLGITMSQALESMRVGLMVAGACAAATAVLGVYVLKPNRGARLALSILAVPILLTAPLTGGITGALVVVAILMLWTGPARDWFAGRPVRELPSRGKPDKPANQGTWETTMPRDADRLHQPDQTPGAHQDAPGASADEPSDEPGDGPEAQPHQPTPPASQLTTSGSSTQPGATSGFGTRQAAVADPPPGAWPPGTTQGATPGLMAPGQMTTSNTDPSAVPVPVKIACALTWVFSGLVALTYAGVLVALIAVKDQIVDYVVDSPEWKQANLSQDLLLPALWIAVLLFLGWALGACVLAWFTWRRHNWARWLLAASAGGTFVVALLAFPAGILHQLAAVLTIVGLFLSTSRDWFEQSTRNSWHGPPSGPTSGPPHGPPPGSPPGPPADPTDSQFPGNQPPENQPPGPPRDHSPGGKPPVW